MSDEEEFRVGLEKMMDFVFRKVAQFVIHCQLMSDISGNGRRVRCVNLAHEYEKYPFPVRACYLKSEVKHYVKNTETVRFFEVLAHSALNFFFLPFIFKWTRFSKKKKKTYMYQSVLTLGT